MALRETVVEWISTGAAALPAVPENYQRDHHQPSLGDRQAQADTDVPCERQATAVHEGFTPHHQATIRYCRTTAHRQRPAGLGDTFERQLPPGCMHSGAGQQLIACVQQRTVSRPKAGADNPYFRPLRLVQQRFDPGRGNDLAMRRQQHQVIATSLAGRQSEQLLMRCTDFAGNDPQSATQCLERFDLGRRRLPGKRQYHFVARVAGSLENAGQPRRPDLARQQDADQRCGAMAELDCQPSSPLLTDLRAIAQLSEVAIEDLARLLCGCRGRLLADHQVLIHVRQAAYTVMLDQAQQQIILQGLRVGTVVTVQVEHYLATQQPVPRHEPWLTAQQIQIAARPAHSEQAPITVTLDFVGGNGLASRGLGKLYRQTHQSTSKKHITGLKQQQPLAGQLAHQLVQMRDPVALCDLDEVQGVPRGGNRRRFAGLEHHQLEIAHAAGQQAVEGCLQGQVIVVQVKHDEGNLRRRVLGQMGLHSLVRSLIRGGRIDRREHLPRWRVEQGMACLAVRYPEQPCHPVAHLAGMVRVVLTGQHLIEGAAHLDIEQAQTQRLPVTLLKTLTGVIGVHHQQVALTDPGPLEGMPMTLAGRPGMTEELHLGQLIEQRAIRLEAVISGQDARVMPTAPLTQSPHSLDHTLLVHGRGQFLRLRFADHIGLLQMGDCPAQQDCAGQCHPPACSIEPFRQRHQCGP
ncbi:hypothetical protein WR25_13225 [Diploscapter pachys]|uniref:Uncharacterized protein n=1 Tax=Diploscapter pachys TaxID=2018661 RepID=A0A2A2KD20_9BILA|nr:hypothetical protein WR25_13225 [Diploscapter pachys]